MIRVALAVLVAASLSAPALAFDPQPDPPMQKQQASSQPQQTVTQQNLGQSASRSLPNGRTLSDYNIQKVSD